MAKNAKMLARKSGIRQRARNEDCPMLRDRAIFAEMIQRKRESERQHDAFGEAKMPEEFPTSRDQIDKIPARLTGGNVCEAP